MLCPEIQEDAMLQNQIIVPQIREEVKGIAIDIAIAAKEQEMDV